MKKAVVLLPTFNEKENIKKTVAEIFNEEKELAGWKLEIVIADSNSPDGTFEVAKELEKKDRRVHAISVGKGLGVGSVEGHRYSIQNLKPDALVQMDADGQVGVEVIKKLLKVIDEGYDLALGSRFIKGGENKLSFTRRLFSSGMSLICRVIMGPFSILEFANSSRAFTPELFNKINLERLPWKEQTFIIQPAFLNEAILAGAKYKEVPLVFKNREEGYSKNKIFNYTYDVITYTIDVRLHKWGINFPFFHLTRRAKVIVKFGLVGVVGTLVDFFFYKMFINFGGLTPAMAKGLSTELAIINNFYLNNFWTFKYRKTNTSYWQKLGIFNLVSLGGLAIGVLIVKLLHSIYGDGFVQIGDLRLAYNNFYFFATIPPVMIWNFTVNHLITWKHQED